MIDVYELARILPETNFKLAVYDPANQTADWLSDKPFKFGELLWFDAEGLERNFVKPDFSKPTVKIIPFSPEALELWRSSMACLGNWAKNHPDVQADRA